MVKVTNHSLTIASVISIFLVISCGEAQFSGTTVEQQDKTSTTDVSGQGNLPPQDQDAIQRTSGDPKDAKDIDVKGTVGNGGEPFPGDDNGKDDGDQKDEEPLKLTKEFTSSSLKDSETTFDINHEKISQDYTLRKLKTTESLENDFIQKSLTDKMDMFEQGYSGKPESETYQQKSQGILDLLVVIDNSGSMSQEQKNLSTKLEPILNYVNDANWQIGVVTTDPKDPCLRELIKKGDADVNQKFASAIQAGTNGNGNERGILQAVTGLSCSNSPWLRAKSTVAVLIVSDEDNCSNNGSDCGNNPYNKETYLTDYLADIREVGVDARVYGLFHIPGTKCSSADYEGTQYKKAVDATNGVAGSICANDYTSTLNQISQDVATILKSQFELAYLPDQGSLKVYVNDVLVEAGYNLVDKIVTFEQAPADGATIRFDYVHGATPLYKEFDLSERPYAGSAIVTVNGVKQVNGYTVDYDNKKIVFDQQPADNADIKVNYKIDEILPKTFIISKSAVSSSIKAYVDTVNVSVANFDSATGVVTLQDIPSEKSSIKITYDIPKDGGPILKYALMVPWGEPKDLIAYDKNSQDPINVSYKDGYIEVDPANFLNGREIVVTYRDESTLDKVYDLPVMPLAGTLSVVSLDSDGNETPCKDFTIIDLKIETKCDTAYDVKFLVRYQIEIDKTNIFVFEEVKSPETAKWEVYLNGFATKDFLREGNKITMTGQLAPASKVKIVATINE